MIQAVLFDVDGTLLDTTEYIYRAFEYSLQKYKQAPVSREIMSYSIGKALDECYRDFTKLEHVLDLMEGHKQFQRENLDLVRLYPHTIDTLEKLRTKGIRIAAITSRAKDTAIQTLESTGAYPLIDFFIALEDVVTPKPDPEGLHKALQFFAVPSDAALMVGDSPVDIEAGRNAKTGTVGAGYGFHGARISESRPDHVIHDIAEILDIISATEK